MASNDLPEDVVIQILTWLPVLSLLRFKCVCKSWCALIQSSTFIAKRNLNNAANGDILVKRRRHVKDKDEFFLLSNGTFEVSMKLHLPYFNEDWKVQLEMVASCNGIVCLHDKWFRALALWNPATRELKGPLPEFPIPLPRGTTIRGIEVGFGFDVKTNDYKVLKIVYFDYISSRSTSFQFQVYSLSTNSWRVIDASMPASYLTPHRPRTYLNGMYFWWAKNDLQEEMLLSFDMSKEVFLKTSLPDVCADSGYADHWRSFAVLNESIALILFKRTKEKSFEIWVLNEYGVEGSWTKLYTIGPVSGYGWPLGFSKNGELFVESDQQLVLCDPITQEIKNLQVDGEHGSLEVLVHKESLISINGGINSA